MTSFSARRPSGPMIVAMVAVLLAASGGAYAGSKIDTKDLANSAVTKKKIKNNAVTGAKTKESTLGAVPLIDQARRASNAASTLEHDDVQMVGISYFQAAGAGPQTVFQGDGLTIRVSCNGTPPNVGSVTATTSSDFSAIWSSGFTVAHDASFTTSETFNLAPSNANDAYDIVYHRTQGSSAAITGTLGVLEYNNTGGIADCALTGRLFVPR